MLFSNDLVHLKVTTRRSFLPRGTKSPNMGGLCILCNIDKKFFNEYFDNKVIWHDNKFNHIYIDIYYSMKVGSRVFKKNLRKEIISLYEDINTMNKRISTMKRFDALKERNKYVSMIKSNEIFFDLSEKSSMQYMKKISLYLELLKNNINKEEYAPYNKSLLINLDEWLNVMAKKNSKRFSFDDPVNILYFALKKKYNEFKKLGNINIYIFTKTAVLRLNPAQCTEKSIIDFKRELIKLNKKYIFLENDDGIIEDIQNKEEMIQDVKNKLELKLNFTGKSSESVNKSADNVNKTIEKKIETILEENPTKSIENIEAEINNDMELLKKVNKEILINKVGKSSASSKRDEELREKQLELVLKDKTLKEILNEEIPVIEEVDVSDKVFTINKNATTIKYPNFEKAYNEKLAKKDLINIFEGLNKNKTIPVFIKDIKVEDTSTELTLKETYNVTLEDSNRVRHHLKFDMPIFIDDKFMFIGGNKKLIVKQLYMKPVVKTSKDAVQICTNYNKIFLTRHGKKVSPKIERLNKTLSSKVYKSVKFKNGNFKVDNSNYKSAIEYDELSELYDSIRINNTLVFDFSQHRVTEKLNEMNVKLKDNEMCVGFDGKQPIIMNLDNHLIGNKDIVDIILEKADDEFISDFDSTTVGKKFLYTRAKILAKNVPLIILLGYFEGLTTVMRKAGINYHFSDTRTRIDPNNEGIIEFADGYLIYDKYPYENSLLMNAFADIPTKAFNYADLDSRDAYGDIFELKFGKRNLGNDLITYYEFMIDAITEEELKNLNYPTDLVSLMIFANKLLVDNGSTKEYKMDIYRTRSNEIVNVFLYNAIAHAYSQYRKTANNKSPIKISIPQDIVIKESSNAQTIEDYSILNPIVELEKSRAITPKGPSGLNTSRAYTQEKRSYDKSMLGVIAVSTSPDGNCGVVRQLTLEPNIVGARGHINIKEKELDELNDVNLFSPAELLSPLGVTRDDTIRTAMASKQSKHIVPIKKSSPVLISNGMEQVIQYHLSNDFVVKAKDNGKVIDVDEKIGLIVIEYTNGEKQAIDLSPRIVKNGAGGFYLSNQLSCDLKLGQTVKKNDIIASDSKFFSTDKVYNNRLNIGSFQKIACMAHYSTYEDSTFVCNKLSDDMATKIIMPKNVVLGKNANIDYMVKVGDYVNVGDELLTFELSFEEDGMNSLLASIGEELQEEIRSLGKTHIKSKYSGIIKDIKITSTVELDELSPTLRKVVSDYYKQQNKRKSFLNKHDKSKSVYKMGVLLNEPTGKVETKDGKIRGNDVGEGVLIEFYIEFEDRVGVGDKIVNFTALKSVVGMVVDSGYEPYTTFRPDEIVATSVAPGAVLARMTPSILITMFGNKVLVELKRKLYEIYTGEKWKCNEIEH